MLKKIIIGLLAGIICGLFSAGGGLILVPAFTHILKLDEKTSRGTSIFAILPMVITSGIFYYNNIFTKLQVLLWVVFVFLFFLPNVFGYTRSQHKLHPPLTTKEGNTKKMLLKISLNKPSILHK